MVLDESVLLRRIGDNTVMRLQLKRLLEVSEMTNLSLRILPLAAYHPVLAGAFVLLQFGEAHDIGYHDIAYIEHFTDSVYIEAERDTFQYKIGFARLRESSLDTHQSREKIMHAAAKWD